MAYYIQSSLLLTGNEHTYKCEHQSLTALSFKEISRNVACLYDIVMRYTAWPNATFTWSSKNAQCPCKYIYACPTLLHWQLTHQKWLLVNSQCASLAGNTSVHFRSWGSSYLRRYTVVPFLYILFKGTSICKPKAYRYVQNCTYIDCGSSRTLCFHACLQLCRNACQQGVLILQILPVQIHVELWPCSSVRFAATQDCTNGC